MIHSKPEKRQGGTVGMKAKVAIVGGGAAGLAAAVWCARALGGENVVLLEKGERVARKLLATGSGTCNLSHLSLSPEHYHGENPEFVRPAIEAFSPRDAMAFFASIGVPCTARPNGRIYPLCAQASAVVNSLRLALEGMSVPTVTGCPVHNIAPLEDGVKLVTARETVRAGRVLIACGGAAAPSLGGSAEPLALLTGLGHTKTPLSPAIVPFRAEWDALPAVAGIRAEVSLSLSRDGREIRRSEGEILFAKDGLSGPAAMALGRDIAQWERRKQGKLSAVIDFLPSLGREETASLIDSLCALPGRAAEHLLCGVLGSRLGRTLIKEAGVPPRAPAAALTRQQRQNIENALKRLTLPVSGSAGFGSAQVTAGGIRTSEFDPVTLSSRICPTVHAAGEILDVDGDCGGYNLHWAWASARAAADAMIREVSG